MEANILKKKSTIKVLIEWAQHNEWKRHNSRQILMKFQGTKEKDPRIFLES